MPKPAFPITDPITVLADRIAERYSSAAECHKVYGHTWYAQAHEHAQRLADRYGVTDREAAGVIAALSPQMSWTDNLREADRLLRTGGAKHLSRNVAKARAIVHGADPITVLGGNKVRSFFDNIADPDRSNAVTVDRHAFDIALGTIGDPIARSRTLERVGVYAFISEAYRVVAADLGLKPHQVQAATWVAHRRAKAADPIFARWAHKLTD